MMSEVKIDCPKHKFQAKYSYVYSGEVWDVKDDAPAVNSLPSREKNLPPFPQAKKVSFTTDPPAVIGEEIARVPSREMLLIENPQADLRPIDLPRKVEGQYPDEMKNKLLDKPANSKRKRDSKGRWVKRQKI
jgi:hypothetical protein